MYAGLVPPWVPPLGHAYVTCLPQPCQLLAVCRNMAVLLDSDSDGMDSDDDGPQLGTMVASDSDGEQPRSPVKPRGKMPTALLSDSDEDEAPAPPAAPSPAPEPEAPAPAKAAGKEGKGAGRASEAAPGKAATAAAAAAAAESQQQQGGKGKAETAPSRRSIVERPKEGSSAGSAPVASKAGPAPAAAAPKLAAPPAGSSRAAASPPPASNASAAAASGAKGQPPGLCQQILQRQGTGRASSGQEGWADEDAWGAQQRGSGAGEGWADEHQWDNVKL
jgi:hypothetical protein